MACLRRNFYCNRIFYFQYSFMPDDYRNSFRFANAEIRALWPFGSQIVSKTEAHGCLSVIMNILWFFVGGVWIFLSHIGFGILFCITILGIPFGLQHFKLAGLALTPFGHDVK